MGTTQSNPAEPAMALQMDAMANYPDMNVIFKGIPKMMQVADDMHRMTNYIMDLRNMTFGLSVMSVIGMFMFLLLKYFQGKKRSRRYRQRFQNFDSEQSSLSRTMGAIGGGGSSRHYSQKPTSLHHHHNMDWNSPGMRHVPIDMEKLIESQHSNSTAALIGANNNNHHHNNNIRQTPPHQTRNLPTYTSLNAATNGSNSTSTTIALADNDCSPMPPQQSQQPVLLTTMSSGVANPMLAATTMTTAAIAPTSTSLVNGGNESGHHSGHHQFVNGAPTTLKVGANSNTGSGGGGASGLIIRAA